MVRLLLGSLIWSLSARRAWIEIIDDLEPSSTRKSLSARRAWIEIVYPGTWSGSILSLSARRAWIEIQVAHQSGGHNDVALRKESVDRNYIIKIT